ncbi:putative Cupin superfamily protein [Seiridium unicorne]|uniref:Cupin superfamily protein n=1 Tax=Seiridium unicorne TaxID=138068 RepID=A0ABR2V8Y8_9PEZI
MILHHLNAVRAALLTLPILILAATSVSQRSAQEIVDQLQLVPNDEKGYYIQTFQDPATVANRSVSTAIYYMLEGSAGRSIWHRLDATEVWHFYAGAPLTLSLSHDNGAPVIKHILGPDIFRGQSPQVVIPTGTWQIAPGFITIKDGEFHLELDAVDTWFEGALQIEEVGALDAEERDVKSDDEKIGVYQMIEYTFLFLCLASMALLNGRGHGTLDERRTVAQIFVGLIYV